MGTMVLTHWFKKRLGLALAFAYSGISVCGCIFPIIIKTLLGHMRYGITTLQAHTLVFISVHYSFQWTIRILGFITLGLLVATNLVCCCRCAPFFSTQAIDTVSDRPEATPGNEGPGPADQRLRPQETDVLGLCCRSAHHRPCFVYCWCRHYWERVTGSRPGLIPSS